MAGRDRRGRRLPPLRAALSQRTTRRRSQAGRAGATSRAPVASSPTCSRRRRRPSVAVRPAALEGRRLLAHRRHCRSGDAPHPIVAPAHPSQLGGSVHQSCAARGLELEAGRVSRRRHRGGTIRTGTVVLAGGAWASSFCRQLGIRFPRPRCAPRSSPSAPVAEELPDALHTAAVSLTRRGERRLYARHQRPRRVDPTPQQSASPASSCRCSSGAGACWRPGGLQAGAPATRRSTAGALDAPTPMERMRILDPAPDARQIRETIARARELLPASQRAPSHRRVGGLHRRTPGRRPRASARYRVCPV